MTADGYKSSRHGVMACWIYTAKHGIYIALRKHENCSMTFDAICSCSLPLDVAGKEREFVLAQKWSPWPCMCLPAPLKLRPYGAIQMCILLLLLLYVCLSVSV